MSRFLETVCIREGIPRHLEWHQRRVTDTFAARIPEMIPFHLEEILSTQHFPSAGTIKCTVLYDASGYTLIPSPYAQRPVQTLLLTEVPDGYEYRFKYADRAVIDDLFARREEADDILMTRAGWILDTSIGNIAFRKGGHWYTPSQPLLAGTTWKRLIAEGILVPRPLHRSDIKSADAFRIFNAMQPFAESMEMPVENIRGRL